MKTINTVIVEVIIIPEMGWYRVSIDWKGLYSIRYRPFLFAIKINWILEF